MTIAFGNSLVLFKTSGFPRLSFIRLSVCSGVPEASVLVGHENMGAHAGSGEWSGCVRLTDILVNQ